MTQPFRPHYGPGVDSASIRDEYQEYFVGDKGGQCVGLTTLPPSCADCLEIWKPQPSGALRFTVPTSKARRSHPSEICFVRRRFLTIYHHVYNNRRTTTTRKTDYILHLKPTGLNPILLCLVSNSLESR